MAKKRGNKLNRRIQRTGKKIRRLNKKIGGLKPSETAKRDALVAKRDAIQKRRSKLVTRRGNKLLSDPTLPLRGKNLSRAARQAERLTSLPGIRAKRNEIRLINRQTKRDVNKLNKMGERLGNEMKGLSENARAVGLEAYGQAERSGAQLSERLASNAQQSADRTNQLQSSVLGNQISALQGANVNPAASGSAGIMAQFAQAGQNATTANAQAAQNLGAMMAAANMANVAAGNASTQAGLTRSAQDIQRNIMTRAADRMAAGSDARMTARSELATLKGLRGAEYVNQLMKLRGTERDFGNERERLANERFAARAAARKDRADAANDAYKNETDRMEMRKGDGGSGGNDNEGSKRDKRRLGPNEYKSLARTANAISSGRPIVNWNRFLKNVEDESGLDLSATERRKFKRRYRKRRGNKGRR